jgi:hypothetical protein
VTVTPLVGIIIAIALLHHFRRTADRCGTWTYMDHDPVTMTMDIEVEGENGGKRCKMLGRGLVLIPMCR